MLTGNRIYLTAVIVALIFTGAWAVAQQSNTTNESVSPSDFDPSEPNEIPETMNIDIDIKGLSRFGEIFMIEGLENDTRVFSDGNSLEAGETSYPTLVVHGIFTEQMRDWREQVIDGTFQRREIEIDLINRRGGRALRINVLNAFPISFSFPPLNADGSTRYMERIEFVYDRFEITN